MKAGLAPFFMFLERNKMLNQNIKKIKNCSIQIFKTTLGCSRLIKNPNTLSTISCGLSMINLIICFNKRANVNDKPRYESKVKHLPRYPHSHFNKFNESKSGEGTLQDIKLFIRCRHCGHTQDTKITINSKSHERTLCENCKFYLIGDYSFKIQ